MKLILINQEFIISIINLIFVFCYAFQIIALNVEIVYHSKCKLMTYKFCNRIVLCIFVRLTELNEVHRRHVLDRDDRNDELNSLHAECIHLKEEAPKLAERFRFYQDLRGYVTDLVECLDEKVGALLVCLPGGSLM